MLERLLKTLGVPEEPATVHEPAPERSTPSLAQQVCVAAIDPASGKCWPNTTYAVAGALLVELARERRIEVSGEGKKARVTVRDSTPLGDPELDSALTVLDAGGTGRKVTSVVSLMPSSDRLVGRLVAQDVLEERSEKKLGVFSVDRLHPTPAAGRDQVVARMGSALLGESVPDERTARLVSVLTIGIHLKLFVPKGKVSEAYRRAEEILERLTDEERALIAAVKVVRDRSDSGYTSPA